MLNTILHGTPTDRPPLLIAHGLYGSGRNWGVIAKRLSDQRQVIAVDMRNHGESPWFDSHTYPEMADDLAEVIAAHGGHADVLGHSMGGKTAMMLALRHPDLVDRLIVADVAPVSYDHDQMQFITAMRGLDLSAVTTRSDAARAMEATVDDPTVRSFLLQSLDLKNKRWRLNLDVLERDMPQILSWPETTAEFQNPTLFLSGAASHYVLPDYRPQIRALFPKARFARIPDAGHWLHAEKPRAFEDTVRAFLTREGRVQS
ncbi:alpha/beta fold hydrolase [Actibacterium ureilyticum]|uniref:alpha/beta fold hydrolase n=1 Tax=Actibacterium ureilyticum TaxID=1590614 RepID=UPI000BAB0E4B|nr:alpha/beta fold hydrolase [Actibacterium ureilyticum]